MKALSLEGAINDAKVTSGKVTVSDVSTKFATVNIATSIFKVFPNPTQEIVIISSEKNFNLLGITDLYGNQYPMNQNGQSSYVLNLSRFSSGLYFVKSLVNGKVYSEKVLISR